MKKSSTLFYHMKGETKMKVAQMILKGLGIALEALANGLAFAGCALQDASEDLPTMAYKAQMTFTRSRRACKRIWSKTRMFAMVAWSWACRGLLEGLTALASVAVVLWMTVKALWHVLTVSGGLALRILTAMGTWAGGIAANVVTRAKGTALDVGAWAKGTALDAKEWVKDAWTFRQELTREWA